MPNDDAFLRIALHVDYRVDAYEFFALSELFNQHLYRVRYLLVVITQNFLANNLRDKEFGRFVRELVFAKISWAFGQQLNNALHQYINAKLVLGRDWQDFRVREQGVPPFHNIAKMPLVGFVYFVDK